MAPRGRPRSGKTRMDAAIHAMKLFGFDDKVVTTKMNQLLELYDGQYGFIEDDAYIVLLEALLEDKEKKNQVAKHEEISNENEIVEGDMVEESLPVVPTDGFIDIPIGSSAPLAAISQPLQPEVPSLPPSIPVVESAPPPPPPVVRVALQLPPPPPPPLLDATRPLPPAAPVTYATSPPPGFGHRYRRKPCHGWVTEDDEEPEFIRLPSSADGSISPPETPPSQQAKCEFTVGRNYRQRLRSRWDLKPKDM